MAINYVSVFGKKLCELRDKKVNTFLADIINDSNHYGVGLVTEGSLRGGQISGTPVYGNSEVRILMGNPAYRTPDGRDFTEYDFIREGSDLFTAIYILNQNSDLEGRR